jgi:apolipoprotein N-acyltransferase
VSSVVLPSAEIADPRSPARDWEESVRPAARVHSPLLATLSGLLACYSFPHAGGLTPLVFVALVPLLVAVERASISRALLLGWLTGLVGHAAAFGWLLPTIEHFAELSGLRAFGFLLAFVAYHSLQFALFAAGVAYMTRPRRALAVGATAAWWVVLEWAFPKVFPWMLGDTLAPSPVLRQAADIAGVYGLSVLIVVVNGSIAAAIAPSDTSVRVRMRRVAAAATALLLMAGYGTLRLRAVETANAEKSTFAVALVQGGLAPNHGTVTAMNDEAWRTYAGLSEELSSEDGALLVWPEAILQVYLRYDPSYRERFVQLARRIGRPVLVGALDVPAGRSGKFNTGYLVAPDGGLQTYHKQRLMPFGEYVPGSTWWPVLGRWRSTGLIAGSAATEPLKLPATRFAPSICFEALEPGGFNERVRHGAEFLVNITDDSWFAGTSVPYGHLEAATLRAVETRRWLVRASNSGISAFIDPTGRVVASLPVDAVGALRQSISLSTALTPYVRWGNWLIPLSIIVLMGSCVRTARSRKALRAAGAQGM